MRDYVYVDDVVAANRLAIEGDLSAPIINVCASVPTTTMELARMLETTLGVEANISFGPRRAGDVECSVLGAGPEAPWGTPTTLEQGIAKTVAWFRQRVGEIF